jgi:hypothetical protein
MGLDMYLFSAPKIEGMELEEILLASAKLNVHSKENNEKFHKIKDYIKHFEFYGHQWESLLTEEMYWRKTNYIHAWFVQNGYDDNCALLEVTREQLWELCRSCSLVLADHAKATRKTGPFFGNPGYGPLYLDDVQRTFDKLKAWMQSEFLDKNYILYQSSW